MTVRCIWLSFMFTYLGLWAGIQVSNYDEPEEAAIRDELHSPSEWICKLSITILRSLSQNLVMICLIIRPMLIGKLGIKVSLSATKDKQMVHSFHQMKPFTVYVSILLKQGIQVWIQPGQSVALIVQLLGSKENQGWILIRRPLILPDLYL